MASTSSISIDSGATTMDALSKRMDQLMRRVEEALARMDGAPAPIAPAVSTATSSSAPSPTAAAAAKTGVVITNATPSPTSPTSSTGVPDASVTTAPAPSSTSSLAPPTPASAPSASRSSPASSTALPPPTSTNLFPGVQKVFDEMATSSYVVVSIEDNYRRDSLGVQYHRNCKAPAKRLRYLKNLKRCASLLSPPTTTAVAPTPSPTPVVSILGEDITKGLPIRCSRQGHNEFTSKPLIPAVSSMATSADSSLDTNMDFFSSTQDRYTTTIALSISSGAVLLCSAIEIHEALEVFEAVTTHSALVPWPPFTASLDVVQSRQPWPPPLPLEFMGSTCLVGCYTARCVFDRGKSGKRITLQVAMEVNGFPLRSILSAFAYSVAAVLPCLANKVQDAQKVWEGMVMLNSIMLELWSAIVVDMRREPSILNVEQGCFATHITWMLWPHLLVFTATIQLRPIPWPSFTSHTMSWLELSGNVVQAEVQTWCCCSTVQCQVLFTVQVFTSLSIGLKGSNIFSCFWPLVQQRPPWPPPVQLKKLLSRAFCCSVPKCKMKLLNGAISELLIGLQHAWMELLLNEVLYSHCSHMKLREGAISCSVIQLFPEIAATWISLHGMGDPGAEMFWPQSAFSSLELFTGSYGIGANAIWESFDVAFVQPCHLVAIIWRHDGCTQQHTCWMELNLIPSSRASMIRSQCELQKDDDLQLSATCGCKDLILCMAMVCQHNLYLTLISVKLQYKLTKNLNSNTSIYLAMLQPLNDQNGKVTWEMRGIMLAVISTGAQVAWSELLTEPLIEGEALLKIMRHFGKITFSRLVRGEKSQHFTLLSLIVAEIRGVSGLKVISQAKELLTHGRKVKWLTTSIMEPQLNWDPGGFVNSGLGASSISSGGECRVPGRATSWAEGWLGYGSVGSYMRGSLYKRKEEQQQRESNRTSLNPSSSSVRKPSARS
ncbi:unnamed protein product [Urochloa humidicola]